MIESAQKFVRLRDSEEKAEYDRAKLEEVPVSVWRNVIFRYPDYRKWVAHNKTVPFEILEKLCNHEVDSEFLRTGYFFPSEFWRFSREGRKYDTQVFFGKLSS